MADDPSAALTRTIREAIVSGEYPAGHRLVEAELTARFGEGRSLVRLALVHLANEGLVERLPNRGARVRAITVEEAVEIVEARSGLESLCARKAAEQLGDEEAARLRLLRTAIMDAVAVEDLVAYSALIQDLDREIREQSGHATATAILERLQAQSTRHQFRLAFARSRAETSLQQHLAIIDAILAGDGDAAEEATRVHLADVAAILARLD